MDDVVFFGGSTGVRAMLIQSAPGFLFFAALWTGALRLRPLDIRMIIGAQSVRPSVFTRTRKHDSRGVDLR
jgi:hypothetical protein